MSNRTVIVRRSFFPLLSRRKVAGERVSHILVSSAGMNDGMYVSRERERKRESL